MAAPRQPRKPDFVVKTPCDGPGSFDRPTTVKWRRIGEAWTNADGSITCRVDLPAQNCRIVLYHYTGDNEDA